MKYETPICEILEFGAEDVITCSPVGETPLVPYGGDQTIGY